MEDTAEGARRVLNYIENNGLKDRYITGYIRAIRQFALNAQRGDDHGMAKALEALTDINTDTNA
jgi:fructose-bisphosphate aldolase class 1